MSRPPQNDAASEDELTRLKRHIVNRLRTSIVVLNGRGVNGDISTVCFMVSTRSELQKWLHKNGK